MVGLGGIIGGGILVGELRKLGRKRKRKSRRGSF